VFPILRIDHFLYQAKEYNKGIFLEREKILSLTILWISIYQLFIRRIENTT